MNDSLAVAVPRPASFRFQTWHIFTLVTCATVGLAWFTNEHIVTREVYHRLLDGRLEAARIDRNFDVFRQTATWGYYATPLLLALRIAFVTLVLQLFLYLFGANEIAFSALFRTTTLGYVAFLWEASMRALYLASIDIARVDMASFSLVPNSLASLFRGSLDAKSPLYSFLSLLNVYEAAWIGAVIFMLADMCRVRRRLAILVVMATWGLLTSIQWIVAVLSMKLS
ncbi:MAG: hypothetical protein ABJE47_07550 [bacterium]